LRTDSTTLQKLIFRLPSIQKHSSKMGKNKNKNKNNQAPPDPAKEAQRVIANIKCYQQAVYAAVVDLGDDPNFSLITECLNQIKENENCQNCSFLLVSAGEKEVIAAAHSTDPTNIDPNKWVKECLSSVNRGENPEPQIEDHHGRVQVGSEAFPIKEKETAHNLSYNYLRSIGAMGDDEESSSSENYGAFSDMLN